MLRNLKKADAPLMLEWMHDGSVVEWMEADFASKTLADCERFIENSQTDETNINKAIVDENDEYMGTVSLKHVDREAGHAEFAITVRKAAMGKGYSRQGMADIIKYGFEEVGLKQIYWYVKKVNERAVRFYDKNGYPRVDSLPVPGFEDTDIYVFYCVEA